VLKWGVLSTARINRKFLAGLRKTDEAEVVAVASRDETAAHAYARQHDIPRGYGGYDALLHDPDVEAVYISLPNALHVEWSTRALEAGKHVLCEKPISRRAAEVRELFDLAQARGLLLMEGFMFRHHPQTERLLALVREGAIGRLRMIVSSFSFHAPDPSNIRLQRGLDGGALMDVGCYCVSATRLLGGEPLRVQAEQSLGADGVDVTFAGTLRLREEVLAHFDAGLALAPRHGLEVVGEEGTLVLADPWHCTRPGIELRLADGTQRIEIELANPYALEAENFSRVIRGDAEPQLGRDDAVGQARAIEALYQAADQGRAVELS